MFILAGLLALYGFVCFRTGDPDILPYRGRTASKGWKTANHVKTVGKIVMLVACAPILSGIIGLIITPETSPWPVLGTLIGGIVAAIIVGVKLWGKK